jgi:predicted ester cyclase
MAIDMKQATRRLIEEAYGKGNVGVFEEVCAPDYRAHDPFLGDSSLKQEQENCRMFRAAFQDLKPTILASYADGENVVTHWKMTGTHTGALKGIQPTGARCAVEGISISRYKAGRLVETWMQWDALGLMRQLGVAQAMPAGMGARPGETQVHG